MKGCILEVKLEGQGWKTALFFSGFASSHLEVEIFLKNREYQIQDALEKKIETSLYTLYWGFRKILLTLYTYVLAKI